MKLSQKFMTWTFKVTTNLSADKTVIKYRYMASVFVWEDELELVGLVRLNTISGKNQSSNGAVKDHICSKQNIALEMDRVSQTFHGKLSQNFKFPLAR